MLASASSSRTLPMKHQGHTTSENTSIAMLAVMRGLTLDMGPNLAQPQALVAKSAPWASAGVEMDAVDEVRVPALRFREAQRIKSFSDAIDHLSIRQVGAAIFDRGDVTRST